LRHWRPREAISRNKRVPKLELGDSVHGLFNNVPNVTFDELMRSTAELDASRQVVVAIAGAPGSGKSSLAKRLVARLNEVAPGRAALLEMDGYHYDDQVLIKRGSRASKGSP
jgi:pantothenate kinase